MTSLMDGHIVVDDKGVARITGSRSRVIGIVLDKLAYGLSPEQRFRSSTRASRWPRSTPLWRIITIIRPRLTPRSSSASATSRR